MKKKKANKKKGKLKKSELKKTKNKAVPAEVRTGEKWYRRQSPYTMSHLQPKTLANSFSVLIYINC